MFTISFSNNVLINTELKKLNKGQNFFKKKLEILFEVNRSSISKLYQIIFLFSTVYEWLSIEIHVYHDASY